MPETPSEPVKINVTWDDLDRLVAELAERLAAAPAPDVVLAISRGGLVPAGMLGYRMGWRDMLLAAVVVVRRRERLPRQGRLPAVPVRRPAARARRSSIIDEVWDSGTTIAAVSKRHPRRRRHARDRGPALQAGQVARGHRARPLHRRDRRLGPVPLQGRQVTVRRDGASPPDATPDRPMSPRMATFLMFVVNGVIVGTWVASIPGTKDDLGASGSDFGLALLFAPLRSARRPADHGPAAGARLEPAAPDRRRRWSSPGWCCCRSWRPACRCWRPRSSSSATPTPPWTCR